MENSTELGILKKNLDVIKCEKEYVSYLREQLPSNIYHIALLLCPFGRINRVIYSNDSTDIVCKNCQFRIEQKGEYGCAVRRFSPFNAIK